MTPKLNRARPLPAARRLPRTILPLLAAAALTGATALSHSAHAGDVPTFAVEASWPKPLPNNWILGQVTPSKGTGDTTQLGKPAETAIDTEANEIYVADGYGNRRVIVFDATTGAYKRHWGAYGKPPSDEKQPPYDPKAPPPQQFSN